MWFIIWWAFLALVGTYILYKIGLTEHENQWWPWRNERMSVTQLIKKGFHKLTAELMAKFSSAGQRDMIKKVKNIQKMMDKEMAKKENKKNGKESVCG